MKFSMKQEDYMFREVSVQGPLTCQRAWKGEWIFSFSQVPNFIFIFLKNISLISLKTLECQCGARKGAGKVNPNDQSAAVISSSSEKKGDKIKILAQQKGK